MNYELKTDKSSDINNHIIDTMNGNELKLKENQQEIKTEEEKPNAAEPPKDQENTSEQAEQNQKAAEEPKQGQNASGKAEQKKGASQDSEQKAYAYGQSDQNQGAYGNQQQYSSGDSPRFVGFAEAIKMFLPPIL